MILKNQDWQIQEVLKIEQMLLKDFVKREFQLLKQEYWKYSPLSKDLAQFENLKFAVNQDKYFDDAHYEKFDHYQIVLKDGILISDNINEDGIEITKYKKDNFYEIKKNQILDFNNAFFTSGYEIKVKKNYNVKKPIVIYNYFSKDFWEIILITKILFF